MAPARGARKRKPSPLPPERNVMAAVARTGLASATASHAAAAQATALLAGGPATEPVVGPLPEALNTVEAFERQPVQAFADAGADVELVIAEACSEAAAGVAHIAEVLGVIEASEPEVAEAASDAVADVELVVEVRGPCEVCAEAEAHVEQVAEVRGVSVEPPVVGETLAAEPTVGSGSNEDEFARLGFPGGDDDICSMEEVIMACASTRKLSRNDSTSLLDDLSDAEQEQPASRGIANELVSIETVEAAEKPFASYMKDRVHF